MWLSDISTDLRDTSTRSYSLIVTRENCAVLLTPAQHTSSLLIYLYEYLTTFMHRTHIVSCHVHGA